MANNTSKIIGISCAVVFVILFLCIASALLLYVFGLGRPLGPIDPLSGGNASFTVVNNSATDICKIYINTATSYPKISGNKLKIDKLLDLESYYIENIPEGKYDLNAEACDNSVSFGIAEITLDSNSYTWYIGVVD